MSVRLPTAVPVLQRAHQFHSALLTRQDSAVDARLRQLLGDEAQWELLARLAPYDRAHHLAVYNRLVEQGHSAPDLLRAALLHDIGKADARSRVRLLHRVAIVVLRSVCPGALRRINRDTMPGLFHGLYLAQHHARLGSALAQSVGCTARTCALIALHERRDDVGDAELSALIAADERPLR